jgi:hypothetical protein
VRDGIERVAARGERDQDHVLGGDLIEAERGGLHPRPAALRVARRHVAPHVIVMAVGAQDAAAEGDLLAELLLGHAVVLPEVVLRLDGAINTRSPGCIRPRDPIARVTSGT